VSVQTALYTWSCEHRHPPYRDTGLDNKNDEETTEYGWSCWQVDYDYHWGCSYVETTFCTTQKCLL